ncbi:MAG: sigma-70 family RNA polymerase sigma factor [Deltaproteobacteria bacterium]|nr:sigma-70 family RNA polymerase sigma factor [Deltaproteobacteria bacterium]
MKRDASVIALAPRRAVAELQARSDDELMRLSSAGLLEAFSTLVRRHEGAVRGFCARLLGGGASGDDAAQDVFLEVWKSRTRYQSQGRFRSFLFAAARNRCFKELRSRPATPIVDDHQIVDASDHLETFLADERRQQLDQLISRLPPKLRDAIWLRYAADMQYDEIAYIVKRPVETVRSRVFHGLSRLRKSFGGSSEGQGR